MLAQLVPYAQFAEQSTVMPVFDWVGQISMSANTAYLAVLI